MMVLVGGRGVSRPAASAMLRFRPSLVEVGGRSMRVASFPFFAVESDLPVLPGRGEAPRTPRTGMHAERAPVVCCSATTGRGSSSSVLARHRWCRVRVDDIRCWPSLPIPHGVLFLCVYVRLIIDEWGRGAR